MPIRLILGCGYLGRRIAAAWQSQGDEVHAVTRSAERARDWQAAGLIAHQADVTQPATLQRLPAADTVLIAIGFDRQGPATLSEVYVQGTAHLLAALPSRTGQIIYISSTGVYGPGLGEAIDEDSPCHPATAGGLACWQAEQQLLEHPLGRNCVRLRLAGIYGPGRIPLTAPLRTGQPLPTDPDQLLNLVHVDDAQSTVLAVAERTSGAKLYVVSDGAPVPRREFYAEAARLLGTPAPTFAPPVAGEAPARRSSGNSKRIVPRRLREELAPTWTYPSYREGLAAICGQA